MTNPGTGHEWLIIVEPTVIVSTSPLVTTGGPTDQSRRLHFGDAPGALGGSERCTFGRMLRQRGTANIPLIISAADSYEPVIGCPVFLYDVSTAGQATVFSGTIDNIEWSWFGLAGDRLAALSCVTFEQAFDTIRVPGRLYNAVTCGAIFADLLTLASGWPGTAGEIDDGVTVDTFLVEDLPTIASQFDKLAILCGFVWAVNPATLQISFTKPAIAASPWQLTDPDVLWEATDYKSDRHDFRDRQYITGDYDAIGRSNDVFYGPLGGIFTLRNPVHDVTAAWITRNSQNTATGTFSTQPAAGDTVTINFPKAGSSYNWAANAPYQVGWWIIDTNNHRQVTTVSFAPGLSGSVEPHWNDIGGTTTDADIRWHDTGDIGFGPFQVAEYTFTDALDNTQYGQVLIGATAANTCQNLVNAINSDTASRGITYSLPTWENPLVNADQPSGGGHLSFVLRNKYTGQGAKASLARQGTAFNWSATETSGGITTFGTYTLQVNVATAATQDKSVSYTPGSAVIYLSGSFDAADNLAVESHRIDGNSIAVENTELVTVRAAVERGTGKYQALATDQSSTAVQLYKEAVAALDAFEEIPAFYEFQTLRPGLDVNQALTVALKRPQGPNPEIGSPNGVYLYRRAINIFGDGIIVDLLDFTWQFAGIYSYLATIPNGGKIFNDHGFDIIFTSDADGQHLLNWEIQSYDPVTGQLVFWVLAPHVLDRDFGTTLYMFYGNVDVTSFQSPGRAWGPHFSGVFHLVEAAPPYKDSSTIGANSTGVSAPPPTQVGGLWGFAQQFSSGSANYIEFVNQIASGFIEAGISFSFWIKTSASGSLMGIVDSNEGGTNGAQGWMDSAGHAVAHDVTHNASAVSGAVINDGAWHYVIVLDSGLGFNHIYVDNVDTGNTYLGTPVPSPGSMLLGCLRGFTAFLDGVVCELHTFGEDPLLQWNKDEYLNQNPVTHADWYGVGPEVPWGLAPWIIQEVEGELIPCKTNLGGHYGHFRYTVRCVNISQIGSYLDFWEGLGGGGDGGGSGSIPAYSGGAGGSPNTGTSTALTVQEAGFVIGTEPILNLIPGIGASFFAVDDVANNRVDFTIGLSAAGLISFGAWSSLPVSPGPGVTYFLADSLYNCAIYDGSNWHYFADGREMHLPQLQNWQDIQGHGTIDVTRGYSCIENVAGYSGLIYQYGYLHRDIIGAYQSTAAFRIAAIPVDLTVDPVGVALLILTDGSTLVEFGYFSSSGGAGVGIKARKYAGIDGSGTATNLTTGATIPLVTPFVWLRITGDGANVFGDVSTDGQRWQGFLSATEDSIFGMGNHPSVIGYGLRAQITTPVTFSNLVDWVGDLGSTQFIITTTTAAIAPGTPSRQITITTEVATTGSTTFALDDAGVGGVFYPTSVTVSSGAPGQTGGFVYIAPVGTSTPVFITATASGSGGAIGWRKIELPIGSASVYAKDVFTGTAGTALLGHVPTSAGAAWVKPHSTATINLTLDGAGGVYAVGTGGAANRRTITIPSGTIVASNFPMMLSGIYSYLATIANGGDCYSSSGFDIVFTSDLAGTTKLNWEIQSYNPVTGEVLFWVQIPSISSGVATTIYMFYGNPAWSSLQSPGSAWSSTYKGVYHLTESSGPYHDSTTHAANSTGGSAPSLTTGLFGAAQSFSGSEYIQFVNPITANGATSTFSCWIKTSTNGYGVADNSNGSAGAELVVSGTPNTGKAAEFLPYGSFAAAISASRVDDGNWHYLIGVNGGGGILELSVDGGAYVSQAYLGSSVNAAGNMLLGALHGPAAFFQGLIEEFRVSDSAPGGSWQSLEYNNQSSPGTFYTVSSATVVGAGEAEYLIPTAAPQVDNDVAANYTAVNTATLLPTVIMFGTNAGSFSGYELYCTAAGTGAYVYVAGTKTVFTAPVGTPVSGSVTLRIACRSLNGSQYVFFLVNGALVTGAPWHNSSLSSGDSGVRAELVGTPAITDSVMVLFVAENADWT